MQMAGTVILTWIDRNWLSYEISPEMYVFVRDILSDLERNKCLS